MSSSSLWVMNKNFKGFEEKEYRNSWLISPIAWDLLYAKYMPEEGFFYLGNQRHRKTFLTAMRENNTWSRLNEIINNCEDQVDRAIWEFTHQQVFATKDKEFVAKALKEFMEANREYQIDIEFGEHIFERWNEAAEDILALDEVEYPYFMFKNSSVDDAVENWFETYDPETEDTTYDLSLAEKTGIVCEFVIIEDNKIIGFENNLEFFDHSKEEGKANE